MSIKPRTFWDAWTYRLQSLFDCIRFARALGWRGVIHIHILWSSLEDEERTRFVRAAGPALNDAWNRVRALNDDHPLVQLERGEITVAEVVQRMEISSYTQLLFLAGTYGVSLSLDDLDLNRKVVDEIPIPIYVQVDQASDFDSALAIAATRLMPAPPLTLPLILRAAFAPDWRAACEIVMAEGGGQITGLDMPQPDDGPRQWAERRAAAQAAADHYRRAGRAELADALTLLAADPAGGGPALRLLARAIERTPGAIDDSAVLSIFDGWSFIDRAGTDSPKILQDVVAEAHRVGSIISIEPGHRRRFIELLATEMRPSA